MRIITFMFVALFIACNNQSFNPKPHAYPRVYYPEKKYQWFDTNAPFKFMVPVYSNVVDKTNEENGWQPFWYNINYLPFNATLHLSYKKFNSKNEYDSLYEDTKKLAYKHTIKADEIEEIEIFNKTNGSSGIIYNLKGNTATNLNFYLSDSKQHFIRGALYFNSKTTNDSIAPVYDFLRQDVMKLIETTSWKN